MRVTMVVRNSFVNDSRVEKEARSLAAAGHAVTVVAHGRQDLPAREEQGAVSVVRVPRPLARIPVARFLAFRRALGRAVVATAPEVLHAHDADGLDVVGPVAVRHHLPFVYDSHELWLGMAPRGRAAPYWWAFLAYYALVERRYVHRAAAAITVSPPIAEALARRYGRSFRLVPNYPDDVGALHRREIRALPGAAAIPPGAPVILRLGGLTEGRGVDQLVEAIADVPAAHLVLLGAGHLAPSLLAQASSRRVADRVHVLPPVPSSEVVDYAASATIGVSPAIPRSRNDAYSLPNKLFQYMAAGIPVLASDFAHVRAIIEGSGAGRTVDMTRPPAIAEALREILASPGEAEAMGHRGRQAVLERYNWATAERELLDVYAGVATSPGAGRAGT